MQQPANRFPNAGGHFLNGRVCIELALSPPTARELRSQPWRSAALRPFPASLSPDSARAHQSMAPRSRSHGTSALRSEIWVPVDGLRQPDVGAWRPDPFVSPIARFCAAAQVPSRAQNNECRTTQIWRGRIVLSSILYESIIRAVEWSVSTQQPHQPCGVLGAHLGTPKHSTGSADDPSHLAPEFSCGRLRR